MNVERGDAGVRRVSSGSGVTLLPALAVPVENRRGQVEVRPFSGAAPTRTIALVWRAASPLAAGALRGGVTLRRAASRGSFQGASTFTVLSLSSLK